MPTEKFLLFLIKLPRRPGSLSQSQQFPWRQAAENLPAEFKKVKGTNK